MLKYIFLSLSLSLTASYLIAQQRTLKASSIDIFRNSTALPLSNIGGLNSPVYSAIDLNNDGTEDLVIYDKHSREVFTLLHSGRSEAIEYSFEPAYISQFPSNIENLLLAYDYDCDGIKDIFYTKEIDGMFVMQVAKGSYIDNKIQFTLVNNEVKYERNNNLRTLEFINGDIPALADMDGDGDMDIVAFQSAFFSFYYHAMYYKNYSQELGFGCDSLKFKAENPCFGQFVEMGNEFNSIEMSYTPDSCAYNTYWQDWRSAPRHTGSTLTAIDHNMDGVMDLVMGDAGTNSLNLISMRSMNNISVAYEQDSLYPSTNTSVNLYTMPAAFYIDVNNDGAKDLLAASNHFNDFGSIKDSTTWLYLNHANAQSPMDMRLHSQAFLYDEMLDLGLNSSPVYVDINNDGLLDLVLSNGFSERSNGTYKAFAQLFLNIGTATNPIFNLIDEDFGNLSALNELDLSTAFADLNGDGALDMIVGCQNTQAYIYLNTAAANAIPIYATAENTILNVPSGNAKPALYDFDGDGDMDIIMGNYYNTLYYYENTGNSNQYAFSSTATNDRFGFFNNNSTNFSAPSIIHTDNGVNIIVGQNNGQLVRLSNIENNLTGTFDVQPFEFDTHTLASYTRLSPSFGDINGDGHLDMILGNIKGGIVSYISSIEDTVSSQKIINNMANSINIYPNPSKDIVHISFSQHIEEELFISLYNIQGQLLFQEKKEIQQEKISFSCNNYAEGIYFINIRSKTENISKAIVFKQ